MIPECEAPSIRLRARAEALWGFRRRVEHPRVVLVGRRLPVRAVCTGVNPLAVGLHLGPRLSSLTPGNCRMGKLRGSVGAFWSIGREVVAQRPSFRPFPAPPQAAWQPALATSYGGVGDSREERTRGRSALGDGAGKRGLRGCIGASGSRHCAAPLPCGSLRRGV